MSAKTALYDVLGVKVTASPSDIRRAYHKLALRLHPDRNPDPDSTARFQDLQRVYAILSDPSSRQAYDRTGVAEEIDPNIAEWADFFRSSFPELSSGSIDTFYESFIGSDQERDELLEYYKKFSGDMDTVLKWMIWDEEPVQLGRFREIIEDAIAERSVERHAKFDKWVKNLPKKPRKRKQALKSKDIGEDPMSSLVAKIKSRSSGPPKGSVLHSLAEKYGQQVMEEEPSDKDFEAAQARLLARKKPRK